MATAAVLVFIDDSGDPGFKTAKGSSPFFVVAAGIFDDDLDAKETARGRIQRRHRTRTRTGPRIPHHRAGTGSRPGRPPRRAGTVDEPHRQIREALSATPPAARTQLTRDQSRLAGIAAHWFPQPAIGLTRSVYPKELYVATAYRLLSIGTLLIRALLEVTSDHGCSRVERTADTSSARARALYSKLGMPPLPSKISHRVEDNGSGLQLPS